MSEGLTSPGALLSDPPSLRDSGLSASIPSLEKAGLFSVVRDIKRCPDIPSGDEERGFDFYTVGRCEQFCNAS